MTMAIGNPIVIIDDDAFKRTSQVVTTGFLALVILVLAWQRLGPTWQRQEWSALLWIGVLLLVFIRRLAVLYFGRDQGRDAVIADVQRMVVFRRSRIETLLSLMLPLSYVAFMMLLWNLYPAGSTDLTLPLLTALFGAFLLPFIFRDLCQLATGEHMMRLTPDGLEFMEFVDGRISWHDIESMHLGQRVLITLRRATSAARPKRWWQHWPNYGSWSEDKRVLRFYAVQFDAGAREIALALSTRCRAFAPGERAA
jgi:hypothetical protein